MFHYAQRMKEIRAIIREKRKLKQDPDSVMESKKIFELFDPLYKEIQIIK